MGLFGVGVFEEDMVAVFDAFGYWACHCCPVVLGGFYGRFIVEQQNSYHGVASYFGGDRSEYCFNTCLHIHSIRHSQIREGGQGLDYIKDCNKGG